MPKKVEGEIIKKHGIFVDSETGEAQFIDLESGCFDWPEYSSRYLSTYSKGCLDGCWNGQLDLVVRMYRKNNGDLEGR